MSTFITTTHEAINKDFSMRNFFLYSYWPIASYSFRGVLFSLVLLPLMEDSGMRFVFLAIFAVLLCFLIPFELAPNFEALIITLFFSGGCVVIQGNSVEAFICNVLVTDGVRTIPNGLYIMIYLTSSSIGPAVGAAAFQSLSWRWIGCMELIWTGVFPVLFIPALTDDHNNKN